MKKPRPIDKQVGAVVIAGNVVMLIVIAVYEPNKLGSFLQDYLSGAFLIVGVVVGVMLLNAIAAAILKHESARKAASDDRLNAERDRLFTKVKDYPELAKEIYQTIEDTESRFRGEKRTVNRQPDEPAKEPERSTGQLFKAAFKSIVK